MKRALRIVLCVALALAIGATASGCGQKSITIGSKQYTENILVAEMLAQLVEAKTDIKVERKLNLGGTSVIFPAMQKGDVDAYVEYTGTAYLEILKNDTVGSLTSQEIYDKVKQAFTEQFQMTWMEPIGMNNTYALAVTRKFAEENNLKTITDLAPLSANLKFGANHLFYTRLNDGYDKTVETYGLNFKDPLKLDTSVLYDAIVSGDLDIMVVYSTDGKLRELDLVVLEDDKHVYPPYFGAPMIRDDTLKEHPELQEVLSTLSGQIDDVTMQDLNYQVDGKGRSVEEVAAEFLKSKGFIG